MTFNKIWFLPLKELTGNQRVLWACEVLGESVFAWRIPGDGGA